MESPIQTSQMEIEIISPLHVGTGELLAGMETLITQDELTVLDANKLTAWVSREPSRADAFVELMERGGNLKEFFARYRQDPRQLAAYSIRNETMDAPKKIMPFIKAPGYRPYLPGSSIRGSIRSAVLRGLTSEKIQGTEKWHADLQSIAEPLTQKGQDASPELEAKVFVPKDVPRGKRPNYDLNRSWGISDSSLQAVEMLELVQVRILSSANGQMHPKKFSLFAESLKPGTKLRALYSRNVAMLSGRDAMSELDFKRRAPLVEQLSVFCKASALNLIEQESAFYQRHGQQDLREWYDKRRVEALRLSKNQFLLSIGWGSGFDAKTITDLLGEQVFRNVVNNYKNTERLGKPGGTDKWLGVKESPKSRKIVVRRPNGDEVREPLGWVKITLL